MKCKICFSPTDAFAKAKIIRKYDVTYFKCTNCGFIQTEEPYWLEEAYTEVVNAGDLGLVGRNIEFVSYAKVIIAACFDRKGKFIDYGGGYGLFVRLMRDQGFDFYLLDSYCENIFAKNLNADTSKSDPYEMVTAIEVFEHFVNPLDEVKSILGLSRNILFETQCVPSHSPAPGDWWYYGLMHGQHISFYTIKSLELLARNFELNFYSNGINMHIITEKPMSEIVFKLLSFPLITRMIAPFIRQESYIQRDCDSADSMYGS